MAVIRYYILESIAVIDYFRCELCTRSMHFLVNGWIFVVPPCHLMPKERAYFA